MLVRIKTPKGLFQVAVDLLSASAEGDLVRYSFRMYHAAMEGSKDAPYFDYSMGLYIQTPVSLQDALVERLSEYLCSEGLGDAEAVHFFS